MATTWIVAADSSRARILQVAGRQRLDEVESLLNPEGRMNDRELTTDAHPRFRGTGGPGSDRQEMPAAEHAVELFAKRVGDYLDKARVAHRFDELVLDEVPKDLSWFSQRDLESYFRSSSGT